MRDFLQFMNDGLVVGSIYALVALGFALIYKSTSILNLAQGEFLMVGAYVCLAVIVDFKLPFVVAFLMTMAVAVLVGLAVERLVLRPMIGEPIISVIMVTIGLAYVLKGLLIMQWGNDTKPFPKVVDVDPLQLGGVSIDLVEASAVVVAVVLLILFLLFFKYSRTGVFMRATANDQQAAQSMGISVKRVFAMSWCIAAVVSAIGGIVISFKLNVGLPLAEFGLKCLPAVILGGLDSILGAVIGGLSLGILQEVGGAYLDRFIPAVKEVFPFVILVLVLIIRPYGLFGTKEIERV
ncbi:MAG: branched-chain amino acid ABC transporter permease [Proteobacteria bacterium]|nr:branched-chain amino acid ABC transporter permease [Pseudomonadota bacterium]MBU1741678.1 branched-chain amino acid ABC transporter permease [Pseudomonadota bacterium]